MGGWSNNPYKNWGDVWYSRDGINWTQYSPKMTWHGRHEHSALFSRIKFLLPEACSLPWSMTFGLWTCQRTGNIQSAFIKTKPEYN
jgi:hypothetical protein